MLVLSLLSSQPVDFRLVSANLAVLLVIPILLTLQLVADQRPRTQTQSAADQSPCSGMAHGATDNAPSGSSPESANAGAFFSRAQRPASATHAKERRKRTGRQRFSECCVFHFGASLNYDFIRSTWKELMPRAGMAQKIAQHIGDQRVDLVFIFGNHEGLFCQSCDEIPQSCMDNSFSW
jgi:hypothetical protein